MLISPNVVVTVYSIYNYTPLSVLYAMICSLPVKLYPCLVHISIVLGYILINSSLLSPAGIIQVFDFGILCNTLNSSISSKLYSVPSQTGL